MKAQIPLITSFLLTVLGLHAAPTLTVGTPADSYLSTPSSASPAFGTLINFDELTANSTFNSGQYSSRGVSSISSPDGLTVLPYSTQSGPNELFDNSSNGSANISIRLANGSNQIGIGIADSDPVAITLQALDANGNTLGSVFSVNISQNSPANNPGNAYYMLSDSSIYGLRILQSAGSSNYSGLAIDDLQFAQTPEPGSLALFAMGTLAAGMFGFRKRS